MGTHLRPTFCTTYANSQGKQGPGRLPTLLSLFCERALQGSAAWLF